MPEEVGHTQQATAAAVTFVAGEQVAALIDTPTCLSLMRTALSQLAAGDARQLVRPVLRLDGRNVLGMMPAYDPAAATAAVKVLSVFPENSTRGLPSHQGLIVLFETRTGSVRALVDAEAVTAVRTAAASAAATDVLARSDATHLALLGTGVQARRHLSAMRHVRPIATVSVWGRRRERAEAFASFAREETGLQVRACASVREATAHADIVCTLTAATEPILTLADVRPGVHVNAVGACTPTARELSSDLVAAGMVYVDWLPAALQEAGDLLLAMADGAVTAQHVVGEIGNVFAGALPGRARQDDITIFESLGQAVQDLVVADHVVTTLEMRNREGQQA